MATPIGILLGVIGLSILVIVHEGGHYLAARAFGMRVVRFSIGFGPTIFKHQPEGSPTTFQVAAVPFLAYVQIAGMAPYEENPPDDPGLFQNHGVFARTVTIAAGPIANYLAASALVFGLAMSSSLAEERTVVPVTVAGVQAQTPAAAAGLQTGDRLIGANGERIETFEDLQRITSARPGQPTVYSVERDGAVLPPITITPLNDSGRGVIGVRPRTEAFYPSRSIGESAKFAMVFPFQATVFQLSAIGKMIRNRSADDLGGPLAMGEAITKAAEEGVGPYLFMLVIISVALGFFNLLPFPALDGGRLVFLAYEVITRRRPNERIEAAIHTVGILFLLGVLVAVTYRDAWRLAQ